MCDSDNKEELKIPELKDWQLLDINLLNRSRIRRCSISSSSGIEREHKRGGIGSCYITHIDLHKTIAQMIATIQELKTEVKDLREELKSYKSIRS